LLVGQDDDVSQAEIDLVKERYADYVAHPDDALEWDDAMRATWTSWWTGERRVALAFAPLRRA
jgi:hypothetical protein